MRLLFIFKFSIHCILLCISKLVLLCIPKNNRLILFSAWFGRRYADNPMYMYEYMLEKSSYNVYWYTSDADIFNKLCCEGKPVVKANSLKGIWYQCRAKMLVSSIQTFDFNHWFLCKCILFDLDHGFVLKQGGLAIPGQDSLMIKLQLFIRKGVDFWMCAPSIYSRDKMRLCYKVANDHIARCNKPRTDALFIPELQKGKNHIIDNIKSGKKAIIYMPTHRCDGKVFFDIESIIDLDRMQTFCEKNDIVFIIKKHFYHKHETLNLSKYPNIFDVTSEDLDSQVILAQADALISDYSASYMEYLILDRPILLYAFDKDDYLSKERSLFIPFNKIKAGEIVQTQQELFDGLNRIVLDWYDIKYAAGRHEFTNLYFDQNIPKTHYREQTYQIINHLIEGTYKPNWD